MELSTVEKFLLIAQHPIKGRFIISDVQINYGIIGAILLDMSLEQKVIIEDNKLNLKNRGKVKDPIISEIVEIISISKKPRKIKSWVIKLARKSRKYKWLILGELNRKRLIRIENRKFLGLIPYRKKYLTESRTREKLIRHLKKCILHPSSQEINNEDVVVLGLVEACKMHKILSENRRELKIIKKEIKEIIKKSPIADAVDKTIKEVQAAIIGAIVATSVATSAGAR